MTDKFEVIAAEKADPANAYPVRSMCRWLQVSTAGFYDHLNAEQTARARRRALVTIHVEAAFTLGRGTYGVRRVHHILTRSDDPHVASVSPKLVRSIMAELGLKASQPRAYRTTTESDPAAEAPADLVGRDFTADQPGLKLVGDITYIRSWTGWLYLATVIDCCTREVIGWSMATHMRTELICDAITMAAGRGHLKPGAIFHSDRGAQYTSAQFAAHLRAFDLRGSMGRVGQCWDNAMAESFFATLKNELVYRTAFPTQQHARRAVAEYIEVFYNRQRIHSALGYRTPAEVATQHRQIIDKAA